MLGPFTEANVEFARQEGFTNMILGASPHSELDATTITDEKIEHVKATLSKNQMHVSALQLAQNHISPDATQRAKENNYFLKAIELAGKLGVPYIGTCSGKDTQKSFQAQVDEIVRVYNEKYFAACEKNHVKILWEPWPGGPNIAISPAGFEALFKGFGTVAVRGTAIRSVAPGVADDGPHPDRARVRGQDLRRASQGHRDPLGRAAALRHNPGESRATGGITVCRDSDPSTGRNSSACCRGWGTPAR